MLITFGLNISIHIFLRIRKFSDTSALHYQNLDNCHYCIKAVYANFQAGFRKGRGTRDQIANIRWIMEKVRELKKNIYFCFIDYAQSL